MTKGIPSLKPSSHRKLRAARRIWTATVGLSDLLILLAAWGPCPNCVEDLSCDGTVSTLDLLLLLSAWNTCQTNPQSEIPQTVQDCYDKFYPNDLDALIVCIEAVSGP